MGVPQTLDL